MTDIERRIAALKAQLHDITGGKPIVLPIDLQRHQDIELTYTSNAIEGNTLTHSETADLIEHGYVAAGKSMREHQEVDDHYKALQWMRSQAASGAAADEELVLELHRRAMQTSRPDIAGIYARTPRRVSGSDVVFPNWMKVPDLMRDFGERISGAELTPRSSFDAHYRLVTIHPFADGNGRTARLLTNFMLLRGGYVPITVRVEDREEYKSVLREAQLVQDYEAPAFQAFMHRRLEAALEQTVSDLGQGRQHGASQTLQDDGETTKDPAGRSRPTAAQLAAMAQMRGQGR
jgi:Fic family protein